MTEHKNRAFDPEMERVASAIRSGEAVGVIEAIEAIHYVQERAAQRKRRGFTRRVLDFFGVK